MKYLLAMVAFLSVVVAAQAGNLPDPKLTPGVATSITQAKICATKWGKDARHVTPAMKKQAFTEYGFTKLNKDPRCPCEIDHLISRELGGADDVKNLWPQSYQGPWNAHMKDRVENRLHVEVCKGNITLQDAQHDISTDWTKTYEHYFGAPPQNP